MSRGKPSAAGNRRLALLALAGLALALASWVAWNAYSRAKASAPAAAAPVPTLVPVGTVGALEGEVAPDFTVPTLGGGAFSLAAQRGKPTVIFIMAYWCGTCIPEAQALARLHQEYGDRLSILALDVDPSSTPEALAQFKAAVGDPDYAWGFDVGQEVAKAYKVFSLDTTIIIDANGVVVYRDNFPTPYENLKEVLDPLVQG